jgi:hypothetical protein
VTALRFTGDWLPLYGVCAALLLGAAAFLLCRRQTKHAGTKLARSLPWLRATAVALITLILTEPVLHHRHTVGSRTKLLLLVDCSQSMSVSDPELSLQRKISIAQNLHLLPQKPTTNQPNGDALDRKTRAALEKLDAMPRAERLRAALLDGGASSLLAQLAEQFEVELAALNDSHTQLLWTSSDGLEKSPTELPTPSATTTDLRTPLLERINARPPRDASTQTAPATDSHSAVVLFSDGQHNLSGSPVDAAKQLSDRNIPLLTVGFGNEAPPPDLAIAGIDAPEIVFVEDRIHGSFNLYDDLPNGQPFQISIRCGDVVVWEKEMLSAKRHLVKVPFDFAVKPLLNATPGAHVSSQAVRLDFQAVISPAPQERELRNNQAQFSVLTTSGKRRLLLLDGRPRWETRYLRNLFERDPQWQINALIADESDSVSRWPRGSLNGSFPSTEVSLKEYDLVILGDVPPGLLSDTELKWLERFVSKSGGGLLLLDGIRHSLEGYTEGPLAAMLPVSFPPTRTQAPAPQLERLEPTARGLKLAALTLEPSENGNSEAWRSLAPPRNLRRCEILPGSEPLLEGVSEADRAPALVQRRYGAGRVLYQAFDESWRWRKEIAGKYQERYWSQLVQYLSQTPFPNDTAKFVISTDAITYNPGDKAEIRVRLRDRAEASAKDEARAVLWRGDRRVASFPIVAESQETAILSGHTGTLESGGYEVSIENLASSGSELRARFEVRQPANSELSNLTLNEDMLQLMASSSHGKYFREENVNELLSALTPLRSGQLIESETPLHQSGWWFSLVILLLTLEWALRKRIGLL